MRCNAARLGAGSRGISVTLGSRSGSITSAASFDLLTMSSIRLSNSTSNLLPAGSQTLVIAGTLFNGCESGSGMIRLGFTACESSVWVSATSMLCKTPSGASTSLRLIATLGEQKASISAALSYDHPVLADVLYSNIPFNSSAWITLSGDSFLTSSGWSQRAGLGKTACEASEWISYTSLACKLTRVTTGSTLPASITRGASRSIISEQVSYDVSTMSGIVRANGAETGSASVTVHGSGLGLAALTAMGRAGQTGCEGTEWESETSVRCMTGGQGTRGTAAALVTAGERGVSMTEGA